MGIVAASCCLPQCHFLYDHQESPKSDIFKYKFFLLVFVLQQHSHGRLRFDIGISGLNFTDELTFY